MKAVAGQFLAAAAFWAVEPRAKDGPAPREQEPKNARIKTRGPASRVVALEETSLLVVAQRSSRDLIGRPHARTP